MFPNVPPRLDAVLRTASRPLPLQGGANAGHTLVELILAVAVGSIVLAATYASYMIVARQFEKVSAYAEVQETGIPTLRLVIRDLRMAGYKALDANLDAPLGSIAVPVTITDSGNACCDQLEVIYDIDTVTRRRIIYSVAPRGDHNALYMDVSQWDGAVWTATIADALVSDYVEDFQAAGSDPNAAGNPTVMDISLIFRARNALAENIAYQKPAWDAGNFALNTNDHFYRDEFNATVNLRNARY